MSYCAIDKSISATYKSRCILFQLVGVSFLMHIIIINQDAP